MTSRLWIALALLFAASFAYAEEGGGIDLGITSGKWMAPESTLYRSSGNAFKLWNGVYTPFISDGTLRIDLGDIVLTNDFRLTDARRPVVHSATHGKDGSDPIRPADIEAMPYAPVSNKRYLANGGSWVEYQDPQSAISEINVNLDEIRVGMSGLADGLATKADANHLQDMSTITGLQAVLNAKAPLASLDNYATLTALTSGLDTKVDKSTLNNYATASALSTGLAGKANAAHGHGIADVTGLQAALDAKPNAASLGGYVPTGRTITVTAPLTGGGDLTANRTIGIADATTTAKGAVQLSSAVNSTSATLAATPAAVKIAYDLAAGKAAASHSHTIAQVSDLQTQLNAKLPLTGGTLTGNLAIPATGNISFGSGVSPKLNLYGTSYQIGIESNTLFYRSSGIHRFYVNTAEAAYINSTDIYHGGVGLKTTLNGKANTSHTHTTGQVSGLDAALAAKAPLASPAFTGNVSATGEIRTTSANSYRHAVGNYGTFWRQDGGTLYLMLTNSGDQYGNWNGHRPFFVNLATGIPTLTSPSLAGTPTAPTAATGTNSNQIATTAFVKNSMTSSGGAPIPTTAAGVGQWTNLIGTYVRGSATTTPTIYNYTLSIVLPPGGTWAYYHSSVTGIAAGGTVVLSSATQGPAGMENTTTRPGLAWRIQ